jgi:hypothetical protein
MLAQIVLSLIKDYRTDSVRFQGRAEAQNGSSTMKSTKNKHQTDPEIDELVARLDVATKRLNAAARNATRRIEALEQQLVAAEPGLEVWGPALLTEAVTFQRDGAEGSEEAERVVTLGYAKVKKDRWGFAVREVLKGQGGARLSDSTRLLHKAERHLRLLAVPHLTALTRRIVEAIEAQTVGLEDGVEDADESSQDSDDSGELSAQAN